MLLARGFLVSSKYYLVPVSPRFLPLIRSAEEPSDPTAPTFCNVEAAGIPSDPPHCRVATGLTWEPSLLPFDESVHAPLPDNLPRFELCSESVLPLVDS
jgi:hypothetical protein